MTPSALAEVQVDVEALDKDLDQTSVDGYMAMIEKQEEVARQEAEVASQQAIAQPDTAAEEGGAANNAADPAEHPAEKPNEDGAAEGVEHGRGC